MLEAIGYASLQQSFRSSPREALVRNDQSRAFVRTEITAEERNTLIEIEIDPSKRDTVQRNRQRITRSQQLLETLQVTVFTPDDLALVKEGPSLRRRFLDETLRAAHPKLRDVLQTMDRVLRQRNVLLRQAGGRASGDIESTLDIWDEQLAVAGTIVVAERRRLIEDLLPRASQAFQQLTRFPFALQLVYEPSYNNDLSEALQLSRSNDIRRGVTTIGPHHDDLCISADSLDARTRLSQGRQRAVTLALRLAAHDVVTKYAGVSPVLLLDDVFSELDERTSIALFAELPPGQTLLTTAGILPHLVEAHHRIRLSEGGIQQ